jgi:hypothetical protein
MTIRKRFYSRVAIYGNNISLLKMDQTSNKIGLEAVNIPDSAFTERIMSTIQRVTQMVKTGVSV